MNWVYNICSCISPQIKQTIINYLNSSHLSNQVIEEQKCTDQLKQEEESGTIYTQAKQKSYNFMKLDEHDPDQDEQINFKKQNQIIDVFWYPAEKLSMEELCKLLYKNKITILQNILKSSTEGFDKLYDSQDELNLQIYSKLQLLPQHKKINAFRFTYRLGAKIQDYVNWVKGEVAPFQPLLEKSHIIKSDESSGITLSSRKYKKLMVINQHEFVVASKTQIFRDEEEEEKENEQNKVNVYTTIFSVKDKQANYPYSQGWINLCGMKVRNENEQYLTVEGYVNVELEVSVLPNMLKQPIAKEIKNFIQKMSCSIKKSDEI